MVETLLDKIKANIQEIYWDDVRGKFDVLRWDSKEGISIQEREIDSRKLEPVGGARYVRDDGKTPYINVMYMILRNMLEDFPDNEAFKRINAYSFDSLSLVANKNESRSSPFHPNTVPWVTISFYQLHQEFS